MVKLSRKYKKRKISKKKRKRTQKLKSRKKINQRGGWETRLTDHMIDTFKNPHTFPKDCCPCVFDLLKAPQDAIKELFELHDFDIKGLTNQEIEAFYKKLLPDFDFKFSAIIEPYNIDDWENKIFGDITPGFATLGGLERENGSKHCIVFAKNLVGQIYLFDPQYSDKRVGKIQIYSYLRENNVNYIYKLLSKPAEPIYSLGAAAYPPRPSAFSLRPTSRPETQRRSRRRRRRRSSEGMDTSSD